MKTLSAAEARYLKSVGAISILCVALFIIRVIITGSSRYVFVVENLGLAWIPLVLSWLLAKDLKDRSWGSWSNIFLTVLWLFFLPNTWYVLTDFVHLSPTGEISELYDIVLLSILFSCGFILGFSSLRMVHRELIRRLRGTTSYLIVSAVLLVASFAIYLGRDLRWSNWGALTNPGGIVYDISDRLIDPFGHPRALTITGLFFVLLSVMYAAFHIYFPMGKEAK